MTFRLLFTAQARADLEALETDGGLVKRYRAVRKTLGLLAMNPRHPSLRTHEYSSLSERAGTKVFEAYAENRTAAAYRVFIAARPEIEALVTGMDIMEEDERRDVSGFLEGFWETITNDGRARRLIEGACRSV